jgi:acylphosphatase
MKSKRVSVKVMVQGRVQGVSFRAALQEEAIRSGVEGWVRNRSDGSVEALLQGDERAVRKVVEWARLGPPRAEVSDATEELLALCARQTGFRIIT